MHRMHRTQRMHHGTKLTIAVVAVAMVAGACSGDEGNADKAGGSGEPVVMRMANTYGDLGQLPALAYFVDRVDDLSGGDVRIEVADSYGDFAPDVEQGVVQDVSTGEMDLGWVGTRIFDALGVRSLQALTAPMLVDSYALQGAIIESGITQEMLPDLDEVGVVGLGILADGLRKPIGVDGPIVGPADWQGIAFGTFKSKTQEQAIRALGASPQVVFGPYREEAINDGTIQGFEMGLHIYQRNPEWSRLAPYVTANVNLWPQMDVLIVNPETLRSLTEEQRGWVEEAARDAASRSADLVGTDARNIEGSCEAGARFALASETDLSALQEAFGPVYAALEQDAETNGYIEQIRALKEATSPEPAPAIPAGCTGEAPSDDGATTGNAPAYLNGVYRWTITKEDAIAAGAGDDPDYPTTQTVWLEDGSWRNRGTQGGNVGTYWVDGDRISFEWPAFDDVSTFTFSRDDQGNLTLEPVPPMDPGGALLWSLKTWVKIG